MPYKEPQRRSIRLDDDVYKAVRALPESLNKYLRRSLIGNGAPELHPMIEHRQAQHRAAAVERAPRDTVRKPLLKPSQRK